MAKNNLMAWLVPYPLAVRYEVRGILHIRVKSKRLFAYRVGRWLEMVLLETTNKHMWGYWPKSGGGEARRVIRK